MDDSICIAKLNNGAIKGISPKKNHLHSVCTSLENILTDRKKKFLDKVQSLLVAWEQIANFVVETSAESPQPFFDFLFLNTLRFVLRADWEKTVSVPVKTHLGVILQRIVTILNKSQVHHSILEQSRVLESLVKDPWGQPALSKILHSHDVDLKDCVEYFKAENGKIVTVRLEMLLMSKCEDLAINLSKACINANNHFNEDLEELDTLDFNQDEIDYITDIYFSCLSKKKRTQEIIDEIKKYQIDDGLRLLQRYRLHSVGGKFKERCKAARVWKCNDKIIHLLSETLLAKAVLHGDLSEPQSQLEDLIEEWANVRTVDGALPTVALEMIRKFVLIARSSKHIYPFCSLLIHNGNCKEQYFNMVARCLIRAINQNMNEVEQHRVNREREKLKETYCQLSKGFLLLSELLAECHNIYKECLLTSFSLTPTRERLQTIEAFVTQLANAADSSKELTPEQSVTNEPIQSMNSSNLLVEKPSISDENITTVESVSVRLENDSSHPSETVFRSPSLPKTSGPTDSTNINRASETLSNADNPNPVPMVVESSSVTKDSDTNTCERSESIAISEASTNQDHEELGSVPVSNKIDSKKGSSLTYINELENLELDEDMGGDLNIILSYRRYHTLTWDVEWTELRANCEKYLEDFEKKDFDDIELKYLDLDYNLFKDQPINYDDTYGIEKGYEQFAFSPPDSEEEVSSTKKSGVSSIDSDEDILLIHRKRKKIISSDSDEPKPKKKRGRKPKPKIEEPKRRNSVKSDTGSNPEDDRILDSIDSIIESVIAESSSPENLKKLRSFRITSLKPVNDRESFIDDNHNESVLSEEMAKKYEELNNCLAEQCRSLDCVEIPPMPKFNVYDEILDNTLVPSDSEIRLPKCKDLIKNNNENIFAENIPCVESSKHIEKPRKAVVKEKKSIDRKRTPKVPSSKAAVTARSADSYLSYSSCQRTPHSTLLSNDDLFKRKYGSKQKSDEKSLENQCGINTNVSPVVQLPKLCETFNKKSFVMKPIDQNVSFNTYPTYCFDKSPISQPFCGTSNENVLNDNSVSHASANSVNGVTSGDDIEEIRNFIVNTESTNYASIYSANPAPVFQHQKTAESTCQTDFSSSDDDYLQLFKNVSSNCANYTQASESRIPFSVQNNVPEVIPTVSTDTSISSPVIDQSSSAVSSYSSSMHSNHISPKKTEAVRISNILNNYTTTITAHPELKNVPAPRKRNNSNNTPKKSRSRAKKNPPAMDESVGYLSHAGINPANCKPPPVSQETIPSMFNNNTATSVDSYCAIDSNHSYDASPAKLPPIGGSSQIIRVPELLEQRLPSRSNVPPAKQCESVKVKLGTLAKLNGAAKYVPSHQSTVLKTLLTQGTTANQQSNFSVSASSARNTHQTTSPFGQVLQQNINPTKRYYNLNTPQGPAAVSQPSYTTQLENQSSQQPKTTQNLKGYGALSKNFAVRLSRIDSKPGVNHSIKNMQFSYTTKTTNKTNLASVCTKYQPQVVLPILPINDSMFNMSDTNDYHVRNNFNAKSTACSAGLTETTQHVQDDAGGYQLLRDVNTTTAIPSDNSAINPLITVDNQYPSNVFPSNSLNVETTAVQRDNSTMNSIINSGGHFSSDVAHPTDTHNFKNENTPIVFGTVEGSNTISLPENCGYEEYFSNWADGLY